MEKLKRGAAAAQQRAYEILKRVEGIENPIVVEVGVDRGALSRVLLSERSDLILYMVDSWLGTEHQPEDYKATKDIHALKSQAAADKAYAQVKGLADKYPGRAHIIKMDSVRAGNYFQEGSVDLVFIDADHSYEGCMADINTYLEKTRMWIGGHDYKNHHPPYDFSGVDKAVDEVFDEVEEGLNVTWFKKLY